MNYFDHHFPKRVTAAIIGCFIFILVPIMMTNFYFHYVDDTAYYSVVQPIPVDRKYYKPCDKVNLTLTRTALLNLSLDVNIELVLRKDDQTIAKITDAQIHRNPSVKKGEKQTVLLSYNLPCNIEDGLYYWQFLATYKIHGYERIYLAISDTFNVNKLGVDPVLLKIATESAKTNTVTRVLTNIMQTYPTPTASQVQQSPSGDVNRTAQTPNQITVNNNSSQSQPQQQQSQPTPEQNQSPIDDLLDTVKKIL